MVGLATRSIKNSRRLSTWSYPYYAYATDTATALLTTDFLFDIVSDIRFKTTSSGGETIKIQGSTDGTNYDDLTPMLESTGQPVSSVNLATGAYSLPIFQFGHYRIFKFVKSAGVQTGVAVFVAVRPWNKPGP